MSAEVDPTTNSAVGAPAMTRSQTAHVYVRETLRQDILAGKLLGGTRLGQTDIAKQLGVSTTPVREALRDLASEGLVRIDPHRGGFVQDLDPADLREVYEIRHQLEPMALRLAMPHITNDAIRRLEQLNDDMTAAPHTAVWVQLNRAFHMTIYEASNHTRLLSIIGSLQDALVMAAIARLVHPSGVRATANQEHFELIDLIRRRDVDEAVTLLEHHLGVPIAD